MSESDSDKLTKIISLCTDALQTDGSHHKQWYIEQIMETAGFNIELWRNQIGWEAGVPP